jgi:surface polysaccharide O-acyltransferase-like enzyme
MILDLYLSKKLRFISFISIILVVYLHSYNLVVKFKEGTQSIIKFDINSFLQTLISQGFARIAVPFFFMISGYLFFYNFNPTYENFFIKYKKRFFSLVVPYISWSIWGIALFYILQSMPISEPFFTKELIRSYSLNKILDTVFIHPIPYQLWFVSDLIKYICISPIIYFLIANYSFYPIIPFFMLWFFNINFKIASIEGVLYFLIGSFFAIKNINIMRMPKRKNIKLLTATWIVLLLVKTYCELNSIPVFILYKFCIFFGIISMWFQYDFYKTWDKCSKFTHYTFFIYVFHEPILTIFKKALLRIMGVSEFSNLIVYLIAPILTIIFSIIIARVLKKLSNPIYKIITGSRDL